MQEADIKKPLLCNLSDEYAIRVKNTAATAYGGTVNNWAFAFAINAVVRMWTCIAVDVTHKTQTF